MGNRFLTTALLRQLILRLHFLERDDENFIFRECKFYIQAIHLIKVTNKIQFFIGFFVIILSIGTNDILFCMPNGDSFFCFIKMMNKIDKHFTFTNTKLNSFINEMFCFWLIYNDYFLGFTKDFFHFKFS